jgi:RNA polymerase sigma-70 factor, ECF subfamily
MTALDRTDEELLRQVAGGDVAAFEAVYDRHAATVYGMIRGVLRDPAQSEEVAQEVLLEVWRTAARFDPGRGTPRTWILTMARRRAVDRVRAAQAAADRDLRHAVRNGRREYDEVSEAVELRLEHRQVRRCLETLAPNHREPIDLAYYGGHTYREVSELLGLPAGTVKTRMRAGLLHLRDCLGTQDRWAQPHGT